MKKQKKQLVLLVSVLVLLVAGFLGLKKYNEVQSEKPAEEDIVIVAFDDEDIERFSYDYQGEEYTFEKEDDVWYYTENPSLNLDQQQIKTMLAKIAPLKVEAVIPQVTDKLQYGLAELSGDTTNIRYETASESIVLEVGNYNSIENVYYVAMPSETTIYTVLGNVITGFSYTLEDLLVAEAEADAEAESAGEATGEAQTEAESAGEATGE